jgi:ribosome maturation factor RimP
MKSGLRHSRICLHCRGRASAAEAPERLDNNRSKIEAQLAGLSALAEKVADQFGLFIVEVKFGQLGKRRTLEVTIFRPDRPVSHTDCEQMSRSLEAVLDKQMASDEPLLQGAYMLEVQSPGIDRVLKTAREFQIFAGQKVLVETKTKVGELGHNFVGILLGLADGTVKFAHAKPVSRAKNSTDQSELKDVSVEHKQITKIRLYAPDLAPKSNKN